MGGEVGFVDAMKAKYLPSKDDVAPEADLEVAVQGQKEKKKWEMVGMEKLKSKTSQLASLRFATLQEETLTAAGDADEIAKTFPVLQQLDLSKCQISDLAIPAAITRALPELRHLDLSANPLSGTWDSDAFSKLTTLVLNHTGVQWKEVTALSAPNLRTLHLEGNGIVDFSADGPLGTSGLVSLNLTANKISSWEGVLSAIKHLPSLTDLCLGGNELPPPTVDQAQVLASSGLTSLSIPDNKEYNEVDWLVVLGKSPNLKSLKLRYPSSSTAPNLARLRLVVTMPGLEHLNSSEVRPKERAEAEKYYLHIGHEELKSKYPSWKAGDDLPEAFLASYPYYLDCVKRHGDPAAGGHQGQASGMASGVVDLVLRGMSKKSVGRPDITRSLPVVIKVAQLKAVLKAAFGVPPEEQALFYKSTSDDISATIELSNDLETLAAHGICGAGIVEIHDP